MHTLSLNTRLRFLLSFSSSIVRRSFLFVWRTGWVSRAFPCCVIFFTRELLVGSFAQIRNDTDVCSPWGWRAFGFWSILIRARCPLATERLFCNLYILYFKHLVYVIFWAFASQYIDLWRTGLSLHALSYCVMLIHAWTSFWLARLHRSAWLLLRACVCLEDGGSLEYFNSYEDPLVEDDRLTGLFETLCPFASDFSPALFHSHAPCRVIRFYRWTASGWQSRRGLQHYTELSYLAWSVEGCPNRLQAMFLFKVSPTVCTLLALCILSYLVWFVDELLCLADTWKARSEGFKEINAFGDLIRFRRSTYRLLWNLIRSRSSCF